MNPRTSAILLLVAAALGAFVYFYEIRGEEQRLEAEAREKRLFADLESEDVAWVELTTSDDTAVRAERREGGWEIVEPLVFPGDEFALDGIASALAEMSSEAVYEEPQPPEVYGLGDAAPVLRFGAGDAEQALRLGDAAPLGGNSYVSVVGERPVYTVPTYRTSSLRKSFDDLRDKRILGFDAAAIERIVASWPDGRVELVREDETWRLTAPVEGPADAQVVEDLLSDLSFLRATGFEDEPPPDAEAGLASPAFEVALTLAPSEEGGERRRLQLAISSRVQDGSRLVRAQQPSLYRVTAERLDDFPRRSVDYRFKRLADFRTTDAKRLELVFAAPEGDPVRITAAREEGSWKSRPEAMEPGTIARLVDELARLRARDILAERVGPDELRSLGLDPPNATLLVYGEGEGEEAERLAEVRLGVVRGESGIAAQSGENPQLFELDLERAEHLPVSLEGFRNRFVADSEGPESPPQEELEEPAAPDPS